MFGALKKAFGAGVAEVSAARSENTDVLEAYIAAAALMATADGEVEEAEKSKTVKILSQAKDLKGLFSVDQIEKQFDMMCKKAVTGSGKQELIGEFEDLKRMTDSQRLRDNIYLFAKDVCMADGQMEEAEAKRLAIVANLLDVDTKKFALDDL